MDASALPEQMQVRLDKRERLLAAGQQAYPVSVPRTHTIAQVRAEHPDLESGSPGASSSCATPASSVSSACRTARASGFR